MVKAQAGAAVGHWRARRASEDEQHLGCGCPQHPLAAQGVACDAGAVEQVGRQCCIIRVQLADAINV